MRTYIEPKSTFTTSTTNKYLPSHGPYHTWQIFDESYFPNATSGYTPLIGITPPHPALGTKSDERIGNQITVNSYRLQLWLKMGIRWWAPHWGNIFCEEGDYPMPDVVDDNQQEWYYNNYASNMNPRDRWFKCRLFVIEWDLSLRDEIQKPRHYWNWFMNTFYPYGIAESDGTTRHTVHENLLLSNTPYTGKFNILLDKCLTLHSNHPQLSLDLTIPFNRKIRFSETSTNQVDAPVMSFIIMPPLSTELDMDPASAFEWQYAEQGTSSRDASDFLNVRMLLKTNFTDL